MDWDQEGRWMGSKEQKTSVFSLLGRVGALGAICAVRIESFIRFIWATPLRPMTACQSGKKAWAAGAQVVPRRSTIFERDGVECAHKAQRSMTGQGNFSDWPCNCSLTPACSRWGRSGPIQRQKMALRGRPRTRTA